MKKIFIFTIFSLLSLFSVNYSLAVPEIYIGIENPSSPTNKDKFNLSFTTLDMLGRPLTVRCFKVNPDNSEVQLGADVAVKAGGNSGVCSLENNPLSESGKTYQFYAVAFAGADTSVSEKVSVDFNSTSPNTPNDYSKDKVGSCSYKINFRASNDGRTTKIRIYRADVTKFIADAGSQVGEVNLSPDQKGSFTDGGIPDCNKTYYYVIRAFDNAGNASGLVGDSITVTTSATSTNPATSNSSSPAAGAIAINGGSNIPQENIDSVTGQPETTPTITIENPESGTVLGAKDSESFVSQYKLPLILTGLVLLSIIGYGFKKAQNKRR